MAISYNQFSMSNSFQPLQFYKGISRLMPPPGFIHQASTESTILLKSFFEVMTNAEGVTMFNDMVLTLERKYIHMVLSLLTSDSDYFMEIIGNQYGSKRIQNIIGKSDDVDMFLYAAIVRCFPRIMTNKYASYVVICAIYIFDDEKKKTIYEHMIHYALDIACDQHGCIALNKVITAWDNPYYMHQLINLISSNALYLSNDASGNFVVQHVVKRNNVLCNYNIALNLSGHCVNLSFKKYGSYIVEKLLETDELIVVVVVVEELLKCDGDKLLKLAKNEFGNYVVAKALKVTQNMIRVDMYWGLVEKLIPFINLLCNSHGSNIAKILVESIT